MERDLLYKEIEHIGHRPDGNEVAEFESESKFQKLVKGISAHLTDIKKKRLRSNGFRHETEFLPTSVPGVGYYFDILMDCMNDLENAAIKEGHTFDKRITAFRKIFYNSGG